MRYNEDQRRKFDAMVSDLLYVTNGTHSVSIHRLNLYFSTLKEFNLTQVEKAIEQLAASYHGHVSPALIMQQIQGRTTKGARDAWDYYYSRVRQKGVSETRADDFPDERAQKAFKKIGGAAALNSDPTQKRFEFLEAYGQD